MDRHLTKVIYQKTRQASPECTHPIRGSESQTSYPRVHLARQAIPGFNGETPWIKGALQNPRDGRRERENRAERAGEEEGKKERRNSQEIMGNIGL